MLAPGDAPLAADLARRAASVSHDGEAIHGAQIIAVIEALAFVESDIDTLIDAALEHIPRDGTIATMIAALRQWHRQGLDWRQARERLAASYGYDKYGGGCHIVPNHGLVILGLLFGEGDFQKSLKIVNTCGWDTDCNSGNLGCILGIKNDLAGLDAGPDFRTPVRDRILLPTADGGRCITDAVQIACEIANMGRALAGHDAVAPKEGARFHFDLPGALQGFACDDAPDARDIVRLENRPGHSRLGQRSLTLHLTRLAPGRAARITTATFLRPRDVARQFYRIVANPTLYGGQRLTAEVQACSKNPVPLAARLVLRTYDAADERVLHRGEPVSLPPGERRTLQWTLPDFRKPIAEIGLELTSDEAMDGRVYFDTLSWSGEPSVDLTPAAQAGNAWRRTWVDAADVAELAPTIRVIGNERRAMLIQGTRDWCDYTVEATLDVHMANLAGIAARAQGLERYYGLVLRAGDELALIRRDHGDHDLAAAKLPWRFDQSYTLRLEVTGMRLRGHVDGELLVEAEDQAFTGGGVALLAERGNAAFRRVHVQPASG